MLRVVRVFPIPLKRENDTSQRIFGKATCLLSVPVSPFTVLNFSGVDVWLSESRKSCGYCVIRGPVMTEHSVPVSDYLGKLNLN